MYTNNLMMAASVLFTDNDWGEIEDFCNIFNMQHISKRTLN